MNTIKKIIHADNSDFFRKLMNSFLQKEGFEVESFENAQEANLAISGGTVDMFIMGLTFADIEGEELLRRASESFSGPIIVVSSSLDKVKEERLIAQGAKAAINKSGPWQEGLKPFLSALKG